MVKKKRYFPTSIVDEIAFFTMGAGHTSITYEFTLTLKGEVSSQAIREALDACLNYYPKSKCILVKDYPSIKRFFRYCWECQDVTSGDIFQEIKDTDPDHDHQDPVNCYLHYHSTYAIDITSQTPIKVLLIRQLNRIVLIFIVHHTFADGLGFFFFLQKFIKFYEENFYHRKKGDNDIPDFKAVSKPESGPPWKQFSLRRFYNVLGLFLRKPSIKVHPQGGEGPRGNSVAVAGEIPPHQFNALRATTKKYQATINDYLLASMFHTIKKWNPQQDSKSKRIYINVPVNLRLPGDLTVGNLFSGFDISLRPESIGNKIEMLKLIREDRIFKMENDVARIIASLAWFLKPIPLKVKKFMIEHSTQTYYPSLGLSNLGICSLNPSHKDEEGFHYMGPARICSINATSAAAPWPMLVLMTYNDRLSITLSVYRAHFSLEAAERFLDSFIREIVK